MIQVTSSMTVPEMEILERLVLVIRIYVCATEEAIGEDVATEVELQCGEYRGALATSRLVRRRFDPRQFLGEAWCDRSMRCTRGDIRSAW